MTEKNSEETTDKPPEKKKGFRKLLLIIPVVGAVGAFAGGVFAGPHVGNRLRIPGYEQKVEQPAPEDAPAALTQSLAPVIVDLSAGEGELHHVKVGIAIELDKEAKLEEMEKLKPRARDAAISYLRSLDFKTVTKAEQFEAIREELGKRVIEAVGKHRATRILFTDFVVQ